MSDSGNSEAVAEARRQALVDVYHRVQAMKEPSPGTPAEKGWNDALDAVVQAIMGMRDR